jgi:hypothetical protein
MMDDVPTQIARCRNAVGTVNLGTVQIDSATCPVQPGE